MSELLKLNFIAGYKRDENQEDILWLCTHPESVDLIFSKDERKAFVFEQEEKAMNAMSKILIADKHLLYIPITKQVDSENQSVSLGERIVTLEQAETKINELLKLFNTRSNSELQLFLTLNRENHTIRGYGSGLKIGDTVTHFVTLLAVKGMRVKQVEKNIFMVHIERFE